MTYTYSAERQTTTGPRAESGRATIITPPIKTAVRLSPDAVKKLERAVEEQRADAARSQGSRYR